MSVESKLEQRLRGLLEQDKQEQAAKLIEKASVEMLGDGHHIIYTKEAAALATVDLEKWKAFAAKVEEIRLKLDLEYEAAAKRVGENV